VNARKVVRRIGLVLGVLVALALASAIVAFGFVLPRSRPAPDVKAPTTPEAVARGEYLVNNVLFCFYCHSEVDDNAPGKPFVGKNLGAGRVVPAFERLPGHVVAPNLTPDRETGLGAWTDGEIMRLVREGVTRDGRAIFPYMPYYAYAKALSDDDTLAVVSYLRTLKPVKNDIGKTKLDFPVSLVAKAFAKPLEKSPPPLPTEPVARGQALLEIAGCIPCHQTTDDRHMPVAGYELAGGTPAYTPKGTIAIPNITSDPETGIGSYTDDEIIAAFTAGVSKRNPGRLLYFMPWPYYAGMSAEDKRALVAALRASAPIKHAVPAFKPAP
jgi:mono/diheme cytochrome c family protein